MRLGASRGADRRLASRRVPPPPALRRVRPEPHPRRSSPPLSTPAVWALPWPICRPCSGAGYSRRTAVDRSAPGGRRSEEHTSELQSLMRISYAVFCLKKKTHTEYITQNLTL